MATIYDVAKRARVSTYTVSSVLNSSAYVSPELTKRVRQAVKELDYTPNELARSLQTRKTKTVGMLIPDIGSPFYAKVVRGVEDQLRKAGYALILGNTYNSSQEQARYLSLFRAKQVDGLILFVAAGDEQDIAKYMKGNRPVVFAGRAPRTFDADVVTSDNVKGTRIAIEYLIGCGHQRIALVTGHRTLSTSEDRVTGWKKALKRHRLPAPDDYIGEGDWTEESGWRAGGMLLELASRPTAIFASNFLMMTGILRSLKDRRLTCPADVQVASSDDSEWLDVFDPPITTVVQPSYQLGERSAGLLLKRIAEPGKPYSQIVLSPELRVRSAPSGVGSATKAGAA